MEDQKQVENRLIKDLKEKFRKEKGRALGKRVSNGGNNNCLRVSERECEIRKREGIIKEDHPRERRAKSTQASPQEIYT